MDNNGADSLPQTARSTILASLLRGRPRVASSQQTPQPTANTNNSNDSGRLERDLSPSPIPPASPSAATFGAVAGTAGGLITSPTSSSPRRHNQARQNTAAHPAPASPTSQHRPTFPNPSGGNGPSDSTSLISAASTFPPISPPPPLPSLPTTSSTSAFANMLRRKPNQNSNQNHNAAGAAASGGPPALSSSAPNPMPQMPVSGSSGPSGIPLPSSVPSSGSIPSMPGGLPPPPPAPPLSNNTNQDQNRSTSPPSHPPLPSAFRIRLVPHLDSRRSLRFDAITRDLKDGDPALRIGRFTDRSGMGLSAINNALGSNKLAFKSKVVSRAHAEIWVEQGGKFFIRDTKSSSGTFLNHMRLSPANQESKPFQLKDGDVLQLGVDYQGGAEDIYKSVKIRVEVGREWQAGANAFNTAALKNLKNLAAIVGPMNAAASGPNARPSPAPGAKQTKLQIPDCCICLFSVTIRQALFIAPCSHTFHYKCIRPLIENHHPAFSCPLCRTFADLDEDVEVDSQDVDLDLDGGPDTEAEGSAPEAGGGGIVPRPGSFGGTTPPQPQDAGNHQQAQQNRGEDAEMSDASTAPPPAPIPPSASPPPHSPFVTGFLQGPPPPAPAPQQPPSSNLFNSPFSHSSHGTGNTGSRLLPISERDAEREREAGGETEVEPESGSPYLSMFGLRSNRRAARERERERERGGGRRGSEDGTSPIGEVPTEGATGGRDRGTGEVGDRNEADEVEMVDAIEYDGPDDDMDSAMDGHHVGVEIVPAIPLGGSLAELGFPGAGAGATVVSTIGGASVGGKRKR